MSALYVTYRNSMSSSDLYQCVEDLRTKVILCLPEVQELNVACRTLMSRYLNDPTKLEPSQFMKIQGLLDYMTEQINIGDWKEVKPYLRKTITITSYIKLLAHLKYANNLTKDTVIEAYKIIDNGILFGCPLDKEPQLLQSCARIVSKFDKNSKVVESTSRLPRNADDENSIMDIKYPASLIGTIDCPSMEYFYKNHILAETPVLLDNCINHWPALSKWKDQEYFLQLGRHRTVPIEIGKDYTDSEWTQKMMTLEEFIKKHIYSIGSTTGYLAQYHLFDHIPELKQDIVEPEYCCFSDNNSLPEIMAWYGPKGTITPLHYDSKKNLLAQVIGEKLVFLFAPKDAEYLYQSDDELLYNSAKIDPRMPDLEKYPNYKNAKPYYCMLRPGQMLYIPPKWWHFVESLSLSFSVSFWWE